MIGGVNCDVKESACVCCKTRVLGWESLSIYVYSTERGGLKNFCSAMSARFAA
jgi:hypothetical protein